MGEENPDRHAQFDEMVKAAYEKSKQEETAQLQSVPQLPEPKESKVAPAKKTLPSKKRKFENVPRGQDVPQMHEELPPPPPKRQAPSPETAPPPPPPPSQEDGLIPDGESSAELYGMLQKYEDAFPDIVQLPPGLSELSPQGELKFVLQKIQRRVNLHHEKGVMRAGLVSLTGFVEGAAGYVPGEPVKLQGLTANVQANIEQFDSTLKQLCIKHLGVKGFSVEQAFLVIFLRIVVSTHLTNVATEKIQGA